MSEGDAPKQGDGTSSEGEKPVPAPVLPPEQLDPKSKLPLIAVIAVLAALVVGAVVYLTRDVTPVVVKVATPVKPPEPVVVKPPSKPIEAKDLMPEPAAPADPVPGPEPVVK
jgi:hypothetical protein